MEQPSGATESDAIGAGAAAEPVAICLLGPLRIRASGRPVALREGSKAARLLGTLALRHGQPLAREALLELFWPECGAGLAAEALRGLIRDLHTRFHDALAGARLIVAAGGQYRLNVAAGIGVDVARFDALADDGDQHVQARECAAAVSSYERAIALYRGDLCIDGDTYAEAERERLRARHLTLLAWLASHAFDAADFASALAYARRALTADPCREDAHRQAMRCHVRRGERAQALRQYRSCVAALRAEFGAEPEPATTDLFERIRRDPSSI